MRMPDLTALLTATAVFTSALAFAAKADEVHVLNWKGYGTDEPWAVEAFEKATGNKVINDFFNSEQEMLTKIRTNPGLYDVVPEKAGQVNNLVTASDAYGRWYQYFNGLDVTLNVRLAQGLTLVGGTSTGQTVADSCDVRAHLPELSTATTGTSAFGAGLGNSAVTPASPYCHVPSGVLTQLRGLSSYVVPKVDLQVSATFQSKPGAMLAANYAAPNSVVAPSLGRPLSGNAANVTVNLVAPGSMYGDRVNQLDFRVGKILKYGRSRTLIALDVYNTLNSSAVLTYNSTYVPNGSWLQPQTILTPRFFKLTAEIDL